MRINPGINYHTKVNRLMVCHVFSQNNSPTKINNRLLCYSSKHGIYGQLFIRSNSIISRHILVRAIYSEMAQYSYSAGRSRGSRGRGIDSRGRRGSAATGGYYGESSNYHLRSRETGYQSHYSNEYSERYSGNSEYREGSKGMWKGNPKNKNTNVEYFWSIESPFSQFHPANFEINNEMFVCAEQYMMCNKAKVFGDNRSLRLIMQTKEPRTMKKYGREVENFDPDIWDMCSRQIVQEGNMAKFSQNCGLLEKFLSTESKYFAEASPADRKWGIGMAENNHLSNNPDSWRGSNWLGEALNTVKYEFQLIIFLTMNGKCVIQAPMSNLFDLFKIGTCEYFKKMKCDILISEGKEEIFTDASSKNRSGKRENIKYKQTKIESKTNDKAETLAPSFDVLLPEQKAIQKEQLDNIETKEKLKDSKQIDDFVSENKEIKSESKKDTPIDNKQKQSPLAKIKFQTQQEKIKFKTAKITFDAIPVPKTKVPNSKRISCQYIFTDWARAKIFDDLTILNCFMRLPIEDIHQLTGNFIYQTNKEVIDTDISVSSLLLKLQTEFNYLKGLFINYSDYTKNFDCATKIPYPPSLRGRVAIETRGIWLTRTQPDSPVRKNTPEDKPVLFVMENKKTTQDEPDQISKNTDMPQNTTEIPIAEDNEMAQEKLDDVKFTATPDTKIDKTLVIPSAGETETENIPVKSNTEIIQDSSTGDNNPEDQQETINAENTDTGNQQETINAENTDTGNQQETLNEKNPIAGNQQETNNAENTDTGNQQETLNEKNPIAGNQQETNNAENTDTGNQQETLNEKNPIAGNQQETINAESIDTENQQETINEKNPIAGNQQETKNADIQETGKEQENVNTKNLESEKELEITLDENTETNTNESYNTSASKMEVSTELLFEDNSNSPLLDQALNKEEQKPKINKKSPSQSLNETDTAKRPKHDTQTENTQTCKQLVSYDSSSNSEQDSAENKNKQTEKIRSKTGKKHTSSEENIETKRAKSEPQPELNLESSSPVEKEINEDDPKEKPADSIGDKPSTGKKKKKNKLIFSSALH